MTLRWLLGRNSKTSLFGNTNLAVAIVTVEDVLRWREGVLLQGDGDAADAMLQNSSRMHTMTSGNTQQCEPASHEIPGRRACAARYS